ncbi:MAG: C40 family peptidase [Candidatus Obscuribacterales bacterium]|nr:C40 family peptidase [Candidatus Obscuribacterales bacterium]
MIEQHNKSRVSDLLKPAPAHSLFTDTDVVSNSQAPNSESTLSLTGLITPGSRGNSTDSVKYSTQQSSPMPTELDSEGVSAESNLSETTRADTSFASVLGSTDTASSTRLNIRVDAVTELSLPKLGFLPGVESLPDVHFSILDDLASVSKREKPPLATTREVNEKIANAAQGLDGKRPWAHTKYEPQLQNGRLAGAASVSTVLQNLGYKYADSANVGTLSNQLLKQGWKMVTLSEAQPGDVVYGGKVGTDWRKGGGNAHVGVVGEDGKFWHNQSATGLWTADSIRDGFPKEQYANQVWVLRPPEAPPSPAAPSDVPHRPRPRPDSPDPGRRPRPDSVGPRDDLRPRPEQEDLRPGDNVNGKNAKILSVAQKSVDRRLWAISAFANSVKGGRLGCAASVSEVLKASGYDYANSAGVGGLVGILKQHGWTRVPLSEARPGDVVYGGKPGTRWWEGGGNAHVGIVGEDGKAYHNSSGRRRWVEDNLTAVFNKTRFGNQRYAMRPPTA